MAFLVLYHVVRFLFVNQAFVLVCSYLHCIHVFPRNDEIVLLHIGRRCLKGGEGMGLLDSWLYIWIGNWILVLGDAACGAFVIGFFYTP